MALCVRAFVVLVWLAPLAACSWFSSEEDDPYIDGDWRIERPTDTEVTPGELLELHLVGVDVELAELQLWVDDLTDPLAPRDVLEGDVTGDGDVRVLLHAPFLRAGEHTIRFGAAETVRTGDLGLTVRIPPPRLAKAAMATVLRRAAENVTASVTQLLTDPDPAWQEALAETMGGENLASTVALMGALGGFGATIEQDYLAVPDEDEPALQAVFDGAGALAVLEEMAAVDLAAPMSRHRNVQTVLDRLPHLPSRMLYMLDLASLGMSVTGDALAVANLIAVFVPGAQPIALGGAELWMVLHAVRFIIEVMVPTDLYELDGRMNQPVVYEGVGHRWYYWGTFQPGNRGAEVITSFDNLIATVLAEVAGKKLPPRVREYVKDIVASIVTKLGLQTATLFDSLAPKTNPKIKLIVNMQAYSLTLGDLSLLIPVFGPSIKIATALIADLELVSPLSVVDAAPTFAVGATVNFGYSNDVLGVSPLAWPTGERVAALRLESTAFRFTTKELFFAALPQLESTTIENTFRVHKHPLPTDPNETAQDHALLITRIPKIGGGEHVEYVDRSSMTQLPVTLTLRELAGGRPDTVAVDVLVNGTHQHLDVVITDQLPVSLALLLERGTNTVRVLGKAGHATGYQTSGGVKTIALEATFPGTAAADKSRGIYIDIGEVRDFIVVTPPPID